MTFLRGSIRVAVFAAGWLAFPLGTTVTTAQRVNCSPATTKTEKMVCGDPQMLKLDTEMESLHAALLEKVSGDAWFAKEAGETADARAAAIARHAQWLSDTRPAAGSSSALSQAYSTRIADLQLAVDCLASSGGENQTDISRCAHWIAEDFTALLTSLYLQVVVDIRRPFSDIRTDLQGDKSLSAREKATALKLSHDDETQAVRDVREAHESWRKFRDAECHWFSGSGARARGSLAPMLYSTCVRDLTKRRLEEYRRALIDRKSSQ